MVGGSLYFSSLVFHTIHMQCPLCLQEETEVYYHDKERSYQLCLVCNLVFVPSTYFLSAKEEKARYDLHENDKKNDGYKQFLMQLVTPMLRYLKPGDLGLDFGSGPEPELGALFNLYDFNVELYDHFYANTSQVLNQQYNFITAAEVVEHLHHPAQVFQLLIGLLNPHGVLGLMTNFLPNKDAFSSWWYKNDPTHVCFYSEATFAWIAEKWKLHIEYCKGDVIIFRKDYKKNKLNT